MRNLPHTKLLFLAALSLGVATPAQALEIYGYVNALTPDGPEIAGFGEYVHEKSSDSAAARAYAYITPGTIKVSVSGLVVNEPFSGGANINRVGADAFVRYTDQITITADGFSGQGSAVMQFYVPGESWFDVDSGGSSRVQTTASFDLWGAVVGQSVDTHREEPLSSTLSGSRLVERPFSFTFGSPFQLWVEASLTGRAEAWTRYNINPIASFDLEFGSSLYFGGINSVLSRGEQVANFSAVGSTDVDYARSYIPSFEPSPVPDQSQWITAVMGVVLAGLCTLRLHRFSFD